MNNIFQVVSGHGYTTLFAAVFARQIGLPVPANLFLLAAGATAATGNLQWGTAITLAVIACVSADWVWYEAGLWRGEKVLHFLHRFAPDPEAADRNAKRAFARFGASMLLVAKFLPGLDAVAPPLAGTSGIRRCRFLLLEASGACLWSASYFGLGYYFSHDLNRAAAYVARMGTLVLGLAAAVVIFYIVRKVATFRALQHRSLNASRTLEHTPEMNLETRCLGRLDADRLIPALMPANTAHEVLSSVQSTAVRAGFHKFKEERN